MRSRKHKRRLWVSSREVVWQAFQSKARFKLQVSKSRLADDLAGFPCSRKLAVRKKLHWNEKLAGEAFWTSFLERTQSAGA